MAFSAGQGPLLPHSRRGNLVREKRTGYGKKKYGASCCSFLARMADAMSESELQLRPPLRTQRPQSPQACHRGASPRRILVSLGGLLIAIAKPTPLRRSWI